MHICYAIASDEDTSYADLAYISARAARIVHPEITLSIIIDDKTSAHLKAAKSRILGFVDHVVTIACPHESVVDRSRFIKTTSRLHITGDFMMIDADAVPVRSIQEIFELDCDLAAALDLNDESGKYQLENWVVALYKKLGWSSDISHYYNAGVIFYRDTPACHAVCKLWHENWQLTLAAGSNKDQPSFNRAIMVAKPRIIAIAPRFNAMIFDNIDRARNAAILHFFKSLSSNTTYTLFQLQATMTKDGKPCDVDEKMLREFVRTGYAWTDPYFVKAQWHTGRYGAAAVAVAVKLIRKVLPDFAKSPTPQTVTAKSKAV